MSDPAPKPERWVIALTPTGDGPPMGVRMKQLIKYAWRAHGLRCEHVPDPAPEVRAPAPATDTPAEGEK